MLDLMQALSGGERVVVGTAGQSIFRPRTCAIPAFNKASATKIIEHYDSIELNGDSLARQTYQAFR
jgi:hypothetical protein